MLSVNEGWLITQDPLSDNPSTVKLFHGVGGRWEQVPVSGGYIEDMMPVAPGEAWITVATGDLAGSYRLVHYIAGKLGDSFSLSVNARFDGPIVVNTPRDLWLSAYLPLEN